MIAKLITTALSAALVLGTASATFAASKNKKQAAPKGATVTTAPQPDNAYRSFARQAPTAQREAPATQTQPASEERIPEPSYFRFATGR